MSEGTLRRGAPTRGPPRHQNSFAFKHNKNSKKTRKIQKIAHNGLCKRCFEKIEWRKKYRKYKPLTAPAHCNGCKQKTVRRAYHTLCDSCAGGRSACAKCAVKLSDLELQKQTTEDGDENEEDMDEGMDFGDDDEDMLPPVSGKPLPMASKAASAQVSQQPGKSEAAEDMDEDEDVDEEFSDDEEEDE